MISQLTNCSTLYSKLNFASMPAYPVSAWKVSKAKKLHSSVESKTIHIQGCHWTAIHYTRHLQWADWVSKDVRNGANCWRLSKEQRGHGRCPIPCNSSKESLYKKETGRFSFGQAAKENWLWAHQLELYHLTPMCSVFCPNWYHLCINQARVTLKVMPWLLIKQSFAFCLSSDDRCNF